MYKRQARYGGPEIFDHGQRRDAADHDRIFQGHHIEPSAAAAAAREDVYKRQGILLRLTGLTGQQVGDDDVSGGLHQAAGMEILESADLLVAGLDTGPVSYTHL